MSDDDRITSLLAAGPPEGDSYSPPPCEAMRRTKRTPPDHQGRRGIGRAAAYTAAFVATLVLVVIGLSAYARPQTPAGVASGSAPTLSAGLVASHDPTTVPSASNVLPIDPAIKPISRSKPTAVEKRALDLCMVGYFGFTSDDVAGAGQISHGRDATKYVPLTGREPELETDQPVWIVAYHGALPVPRRPDLLARDPVCILVGDKPVLYLPYGVVGSPQPQENRPLLEFRLPPLAP